jgi:hypothetical protein
LPTYTPGALEALDTILRDVDGGTLTAPDAIEQLLMAQIQLRKSSARSWSRRESGPAFSRPPMRLGSWRRGPHVSRLTRRTSQ